MEHSLTKWIEAPNSDISIVLRHPQREEIKKDGDYEELPLTPEGKEAARSFGQKIPRGATVRLFHSPVARCEETARLINDAAASRGGKPLLMGARDFLGPRSIIRDREKLIALIAHTRVSEIARSWFNGSLQDGVLQNAPKVVSGLMNGLAASLRSRETAPPNIDIYIAHDWTILALREVLMGIRHEDSGWPGYLDGVLLERDGENFRLRWRDSQRSIHWKEGSEIILRGIAASPGLAPGKTAKVILSSEAVATMLRDEALVAPETNPEYVSAMIKSSAIVTDRGGIISHPAIVARELGIPGVVGTMRATEIIKDGWVVTVDGTSGLVLKERSVNAG